MAKLEPVETDDNVPQDARPPPTAAPPQHEAPHPPVVAAPPHNPPPMEAPPQHQPLHHEPVAVPPQYEAPHPPVVAVPPHNPPPMEAPPQHQPLLHEPVAVPPQYEAPHPPVVVLPPHNPPPMEAPPQHQPLHHAPMVVPPQYEALYPPVMIAAPPYQAQPEIQPADYPVAPESLVIGKPWTTGLFDCHHDPRSAIKTAYLPCITFGQIAEVLDDGEMHWALGGYIYLVMMPLCSHWLMGSKYRAKLRRKYDLVEAPHSDIITHIICPCCALAQEFRELKNRGLDPSLGYKGIRAQNQGGHNNGSVQMNVPLNQRMDRFQ